MPDRITQSTLLATALLALAAPAAAQQPQTPQPAATPPAPATAAQPGTAAPAPAAPAAAAAPVAPIPVAGGSMLASKSIADNVAGVPDLATLAGAIRSADLGPTLTGPGPFTMFAPDNGAFGRLAPGTMDTLLKPENKPTLVKLLTFHVVPGVLKLEQLRAQVAAGGGKATLTTVAGEALTVAAEGPGLVLTDANGNKSYLAQADVPQANGMLHLVNGVLVPKL